MMDHIRQIDWSCPSDTGFFLTDEVIKNSVINKIIQNRFRNPDISSDSEEEINTTDWRALFKKSKQDKKSHRLFVPGLRTNPPYAKLSSLTKSQHESCLAVLCSANPQILPGEFMPRPNKFDYKVFEDVQEIYLKEQEEYIAWAKTLWSNGQCVKALDSRPVTEEVYKEEFEVRANQMRGYSKVFEVVAQILLDGQGKFEMVPRENLCTVNAMNLPQLVYPAVVQQQLTLKESYATPKPCEMHPVRFVLPGERTPSILPVTEVHLELAKYAAGRGAVNVAREGALRCLVERRPWALPVSVCAVPGKMGEMVNVLVLGSEFSNKPEDIMMRNYRAYRRLLEHAFVPPTEIIKWATAHETSIVVPEEKKKHNSFFEEKAVIDDDDNRLFIDFDDLKQKEEEEGASDENVGRRKQGAGSRAPAKQKKKQNNSGSGSFGGYECSCKGTIFEHPPPRSFRKWEFKNNTTMEHHEVLVHCAHKYRGLKGEMLLEPICEYQPNLGASKQKEDRLMSAALSLALRHGQAGIVNVRLDVHSGDVITIDELNETQLKELTSSERLAAIQTSIHTTLSQLQGLIPGHYILKHEVAHGDNALLYAARDTGEAQQLRLVFDADATSSDVARAVHSPPELAPVLLPWHKFRKTLPCCFTYHPNIIVKDTKKQQAKLKTPPQAIKLPDAAVDQRRKDPPPQKIQESK